MDAKEKKVFRVSGSREELDRLRSAINTALRAAADKCETTLPDATELEVRTTPG